MILFLGCCSGVRLKVVFSRNYDDRDAFYLIGKGDSCLLVGFHPSLSHMDAQDKLLVLLAAIQSRANVYADYIGMVNEPIDQPGLGTACSDPKLGIPL
jgi:hypothetical protein